MSVLSQALDRIRAGERVSATTGKISLGQAIQNAKTAQQEREDAQAQRETELRQTVLRNMTSLLDRTAPSYQGSTPLAQAMERREAERAKLAAAQQVVEGNNILSTQRTQANPIQAEARRQEDLTNLVLNRMETDDLVSLRDNLRDRASALDPALNPAEYNQTAKRGQMVDSVLDQRYRADYENAPFTWKAGQNLGYVTNRAAAGLLGAAEGLGDAGATMLADSRYRFLPSVGLVQGISGLLGEGDTLKETAEYALSHSPANEYRRSIEERYTPGAIARGVGELADTVTNMAPSIAANVLLPGAGLPLMAAQAGGSAAQDAYQNGATLEQAATYGTASGALEAGTEMLFGGLAGLGRGVLDSSVGSVVNQAINRLGGTKAGQVMSGLAQNSLVRALADSAGEGVEEVISTALSPYLERAIYDPDAENATAEELVQSALLGAAAGGVFQGLGAIARRAGVNAGDNSPRETDTVRREDRGMLVPRLRTATESTIGTSPVSQDTKRATTPQTASEGQNNTASTGETVNGLVPITDREATSLSTGKNNIIARKASDIINFVRNAIQKKGGPERLYMGTIPDSAAQTILDSTGVDVAGYSAILPGDSVQHIVRNHGNVKTEEARGNQAVTEEDIALIPHVISAPDSVVLSDRADVLGRPVLLISKQIGNTYVTAQAVTDGRHALTTNSLWIKKEKNPTPIPDAGASTNPEGNARSALESSSSNSSIPQTTPNVNPGGILLPTEEGNGMLPTADGLNLPGGESVSYDQAAQERAVRAEDSTGAAPYGFDRYSNMLNEYGAIPEGENPARVVDVPVSTNGNDRVSRTARTVMEAQATPENMLGDIAQAIADGELSHEVLTDKSAMRQARDTVETDGFASAMARFKQQVNRGNGGKNTVALGQVLLNNAMNAGDAKATIDILTDYASLSTRTGQALQAQRMFKKLAPEGQLYGIQRSVLNLQEEVQKNFPDATIEIDPELVREFQNQTDQTGRDQVMEKIYQNVADQVPSSWRDKWNAWRYMAMLANPRTHIRNFFGNLLFQPFRIIKDKVASGVEGLVGAVNPNFQKTKSFAASPSLYKAAWKDWKNVKEVLSGNKYDDIRSEINSRRTIFRSKSARPLELVRRGNSAVLEAEDAIFKRLTYTDALAGYLHANGVTAEQLANGEVNSDLLTKARDYAGQEALKATYQDRNQFSDLISRRFQEDTTASKAANTAIDAVLPFRRPPANILVRGFEYSPLGLAKSLTADLVQVKQGKMSGAQAIDNIAAGLTGSALFGLGMYLLSEGLVTSGGSDDEEQEDLNALTGKQNYALNLPGGGSVTLDWLAPEALPFFMGVEFMEALGEGGFDLETITDALSSISEPMLELSMLQSLNDLIDSVSFAESSEKMVSMAGSALVSYLTQAIPTLGGQIERTSESDRMSSFTDRNSPIPRDLQYALSRASARLPGDYQQIPYIDAWGRTESNGGPFERAFNNFLNPAYTSTTNITAADEEIQRLLDAGQTGVVPDRVSQSQKVDGQYLTSDQYVQYATTKGQTSYDIVAEMIGSDLYQDMTDEQKADAIKTAYQYAGHIAAEEVSPSHEADSYVEAAKNAQKDMGISTAEYLLLYDTYGKSGVDRIKKMMDAGTDLNAAIEATTSIDGLEPETGEDDVSDLQKYRAVIDSISNVDQQMSALSSVMNESTYTKVSVGYDFGVSPNAYVTVKEILPQFDEPNDKGNLGTYTQEEYEAALDSLSGGSPILPGDTRVNLTNDQKAVLWQLLTGSKSAKNNPYSRSIGQQVIDALESAKGQKDNTSQSYSGLLNLPMA